MSFLENIFKQKVGGTAIGNILRSLSNKATDGVLGTGANILTQQQYDLKYLTDAEYEAKYAETKRGVKLPNVKPNKDIKTVEQRLEELNKPTTTKARLTSVLTFAKKKWYWLALPIMLVIAYKGIKLLIKKLR